jgi:hypothetical protein
VEKFNKRSGDYPYRVAICEIAGDLAWAVAVARPLKQVQLRYSRAQKDTARRKAAALISTIGKSQESLRHYEGAVHLVIKPLTEEEYTLYRLIGGK